MYAPYSLMGRKGELGACWPAIEQAIAAVIVVAWGTTKCLLEWLLDLVPDLRGHPPVRRFPVILAVIARRAVTGSLEGHAAGLPGRTLELAEGTDACGRRGSDGLP